MRKLLALVLCALMAMCVAAPSFAEEEYNPDATIIYSSTNDPTHMDPSLPDDGQSTTITGMLYDALVGYNADGSVAMAVAESYDVSEDGLTYTFHIRDGVKFHDGTVCDANAVAWNYNHIMNNPYDQVMPYAYLYDSVESFEAVDDLTFVVTLKHLDSTFLTLQGSHSLACGLVSPTAYEADPDGFDANPVGCGPFKFVEWQAGEYVKVERFDDYYGEKACCKEVIVRIIPEMSTACSELMAGGIDFLGEPTDDQIQMLQTVDNVRVLNTMSTNLGIMSFVDFDTNPIFSDIRCRQAVILALDMESINHALYGDNMQYATSAIPTSMQAGSDEYTILGYDPEQAKALMAEAGYPDGFTFTLLTYNVSKGYNPAGEQLAVAMQAELAKVGITMEIEILPWAEFKEAAYAENPTTDAVLHGWGADYNDTSNILFLFSDDQVGTGHNHSGYNSPEFNEYFDNGMLAKTYDEAGEWYHKAAQQLNDDCPVYIMGHGYSHQAVSTALVNPEECLGVWGNHMAQLKKR